MGIIYKKKYQKYQGGASMLPYGASVQVSPEQFTRNWKERHSKKDSRTSFEKGADNMEKAINTGKNLDYGVFNKYMNLPITLGVSADDVIDFGVDMFSDIPGIISTASKAVTGGNKEGKHYDEAMKEAAIKSAIDIPIMAIGGIGGNLTKKAIKDNSIKAGNKLINNVRERIIYPYRKKFIKTGGPDLYKFSSKQGKKRTADNIEKVAGGVGTLTELLENAVAKVVRDMANVKDK